eukprot:6524471-Heterocapsa_arctica.AAC.1
MEALDAVEDLTTVFVDLALEGVDRHEHRLVQHLVVEAHGHCLQASQAASLGDLLQGIQGLQGEGREGVSVDALLSQSMARAWQKHGKSMARTWQEHGKGVARAWQEDGKSMAHARTHALSSRI